LLNVQGSSVSALPISNPNLAPQRLSTPPPRPQKASLYIPWPGRLLEERACRREEDAAGCIVFRGPRLKMGLREGVPKSISPDHLGR